MEKIIFIAKINIKKVESIWRVLKRDTNGKRYIQLHCWFINQAGCARFTRKIQNFF